MANHLILRVLIMACIFVGGLFAIIATAGKEWQKYEDIEYRYGRTTYYAGLWEYCFKEEYYDESNTRCSPVDEILRMMKSSIKGNYFFISVVSSRKDRFFVGFIIFIQIQISNGIEK